MNHFKIQNIYHNTLISKWLIFLHNKTWNIPDNTKTIFHALLVLLYNFTLPVMDLDDVIIWTASGNGTLTLKHAYLFLDKPNHYTFWSIFPWNSSRSLLVWRLLHNRLPTDENMALGGFSLPSICELCKKKAETSNHSVFECSFV